MKEVYVQQIKDRDLIDSQFLVRDKITAMAKNGKPYMTLKLMDRTGEIEGRVWDRVDEIAACFSKDDFVHVRGKASVYLGKMQLVVQQLDRVEESGVDLADYLPVCPRLEADMLEELRSLARGMETPHYRALMETFLADDQFLQRYLKAPAAKAIHHVYLGGLLEHSLAVARLAENICGLYPGINRDLLVAGALLHDIGKVAELCYERSFGYTDAGKLLGHIMIGFQMLEDKIRQVPDFPASQAILLKHLLLSHHGQYEFGSPKRPKTLEAVILNYLDDLDSKINGIRTHIDKEADNGDGWTGYHRVYDRYFYFDLPGRDESRASEDLVIPEDLALPGSDPRPAAAFEEKNKEAPAKETGRRESGRRQELRFSLADQLRGKNLELFSPGNKVEE
ncbi:MAG: HD domain-containing protein [Syntrophotaleaceae bacterium]